MKKRTLEQIGSVAFDTTNTAVLLWHSMQVNYRFVSLFNRYYDVQLWREEELGLPLNTSRNKDPEIVRLPFWQCIDETSQLFYVLLDVSGFQPKLCKMLEGFDKVLFVYGEDCWEQMRRIYDHFTQRTIIPDPSNLLEVDKYHLLQTFRQEVMQVDYLDGRDSEVIQSSLLAGERNRYSKKYLDEVDALDEVLLDMLAAIEIDLSKNEEENNG